MATPEPRRIGAYRRRQPERTVLYRALAHHFETFIQAYDDRFLDTHGPLRACVQPAVMPHRLREYLGKLVWNHHHDQTLAVCHDLPVEPRPMA